VEDGSGATPLTQMELGGGREEGREAEVGIRSPKWCRSTAGLRVRCRGRAGRGGGKGGLGWWRDRRRAPGTSWARTALGGGGRGGLRGRLCLKLCTGRLARRGPGRSREGASVRVRKPGPPSPRPRTGAKTVALGAAGRRTNLGGGRRSGRSRIGPVTKLGSMGDGGQRTGARAACRRLIPHDVEGSGRGGLLCLTGGGAFERD